METKAARIGPMPPASIISTMIEIPREHRLERSLLNEDQTTHAAAAASEEFLSRPILVGYAFGPKKMSTMGVVMAEASKTALSTLATTVRVEEVDEDEASAEEDDDDHRYGIVCTGDDNDDHHDHEHQYQHQQSNDSQRMPLHEFTACEQRSHTTTMTSNTTSMDEMPSQAQGTVAVATCSSSNSNSPTRSSTGNILLSLDSYNGGLKNIVRYLHSSCSSVDTNSTSTTLLTTGTSAATPSFASTCGGRIGAMSGRGSTSSGDASHHPQRLLRVSFVPLDPDLPLEGQHGAKMDIILHKLTEDILCLSKFSPLHPTLVPCLGTADGSLEALLKELRQFPHPHQLLMPQDAEEGILRVHRLMQYRKKYPECSLTDDPIKVLTLMSRSDIAHALAGCLVGVTSASGIPVASPKFVVWDHALEAKKNETAIEKEEPTEVIAQRLRSAQLSYPLIAKPLQAAGTKTSHYMTVLLNESSLEHIDTSSCLLQEYANHNAVLYKVYVLGKNVHVYQRPSLPNLPPLGDDDASKERVNLNGQQYSPSYVDFDSQRPYPRLSAFGVTEGKYSSKQVPPAPFLSSLNKSWPLSSPATSSRVAVTAEEVQPIVDTLKKAFGLELFGFDILITSSADDDTIAADDEQETDDQPMDDKQELRKRQMLVVDVNYFPSYKELSNFPALLAQYLTQRAVDSRRRQPQTKEGP